MGALESEKKGLGKIEKDVAKILSMSEDIETSYAQLREKQELINTSLAKSLEAEEKNAAIMKQLESVQNTVDELDNRRERLLSKVNKIQQDTALLTKNDDKIRMLIERFEQVDDMFELLSEQSNNMFKMKDSYEKHEEKMHDDIEKAEKAIATLKSLLHDAENTVFEAYDDGAKDDTRNAARAETDKADEGNDPRRKELEELVVRLYQMGWKYPEIVQNTNLSMNEVEMIISLWKRKG
jgi:uncharacterized protein YoxC